MGNPGFRFGPIRCALSLAVRSVFSRWLSGPRRTIVGMVIGSVRVPRAEWVLSARRGLLGRIPVQTAVAAEDLRGATRTGQLNVMRRDWT